MPQLDPQTVMIIGLVMFFAFISLLYQRKETSVASQCHAEYIRLHQHIAHCSDNYQLAVAEQMIDDFYEKYFRKVDIEDLHRFTGDLYALAANRRSKLKSTCFKNLYQ